MQAKTDPRDDIALARHLATSALPATIKRGSQQPWLAPLALILLVALGTSLGSQGQAQDQAPRPARSRSDEAQRQPAARVPGPRVVDLKSADGTLLEATYFDAGRPGPGVLLFHQGNRTRTSWDDVAHQLAAAGINTLAVDERAHETPAAIISTLPS
jgi:hypothetical protein